MAAGAERVSDADDLIAALQGLSTWERCRAPASKLWGKAVG
jgi:hypothetical protein